MSYIRFSNTRIISECKDCEEGTIYWKHGTSVCHVCYGTGQVEYEEMYDCIDDAMIDYPDAVEIYFYDEEDDEREAQQEIVEMG